MMLKTSGLPQGSEPAHEPVEVPEVDLVEGVLVHRPKVGAGGARHPPALGRIDDALEVLVRRRGLSA